MSAEAAFTSTWRVGRYTATLSMPKPRPGQVASAVIEWQPHVPHDLNPDEQRAYRAGRDKALAALGMRTVVIDL
jgi:hypothetical protein